MIDWKQKLIDNQHIEPEYYKVEKEPWSELHKKSSTFGAQYVEQFQYGIGYNLKSVGTLFLFTYIGAAVQAKRQFIPGPFFFMNMHYNWIGGMRYIIPGFLVGCMFSSFNFGHPYLIENFFLSLEGSLHKVPFMEEHTRISLINGDKSKVEPRHGFIQHSDDFENIEDI